MTPAQVRAAATRVRRMLAQIADGVDADGLLNRINAATLRIDRAGEPGLADELAAGKAPAIAAGEVARATRRAAELARLREEEHEARVADTVIAFYNDSSGALCIG